MRSSEAIIKEACDRAEREAILKAIRESNRRQAVVTSNVGTGEYYLSCPVCADEQHCTPVHRDPTLRPGLQPSHVIKYGCANLTDAIVFLRRLNRGSSGFRPRGSGSHCSHIPLVTLNQHRTIFVAGFDPSTTELSDEEWEDFMQLDNEQYDGGSHE